MEPPPLAPFVVEQLLLPLEIPPPSPSKAPPAPVLAPAHLWMSLSPALRDECRQRLVQILQEVTHDARHP